MDCFGDSAHSWWVTSLAPVYENEKQTSQFVTCRRAIPAPGGTHKCCGRLLSASFSWMFYWSVTAERIQWLSRRLTHR